MDLLGFPKILTEGDAGNEAAANETASDSEDSKAKAVNLQEYVVKLVAGQYLA